MADAALTLSFGAFTLDTVNCCINGPSGETALSPLATRLLAELGRAPGQVVERQTLITALWRDDPVVADAALNRLVSEVRLALKDDPKHPKLIQTVPRRGYRLVAGETPKPAEAVTAAINKLSYGKLAALAGVIVLAAVAIKVVLDSAIAVIWAANQ